MPEITPVEGSMLATAGSVADHVPPDEVELNVVVEPIQVTALPVIAAGSEFTVTTVVTVQPAATV